jgi:type III restriction enzyme
MALHPSFPRSPYEVLPPELRWFPAGEELRSTADEKRLPPSLAKVCEAVGDWRDSGYVGASPTTPDSFTHKAAKKMGSALIYRMKN